MSEVRIPIAGHVLVFDSDDIEAHENPRDVRVIGERNGYIEQEFTGKSHLVLHFRQDRHARWETP